MSPLEKLGKKKTPQSKPPDTFTAMEYAERFGIAPSTAREQILSLVRAGKAESVVFQTKDVVGRGSRGVGYRLIDAEVTRKRTPRSRSISVA